MLTKRNELTNGEAAMTLCMVGREPTEAAILREEKKRGRKISAAELETLAEYPDVDQANGYFYFGREFVGTLEPKPEFRPDEE